MGYTEKDDLRGWWGYTKTVNGKSKVKYSWKLKLLGVMLLLGMTFGGVFMNAASEVLADIPVHQITGATFNDYGRTTIGQAFDTYYENSVWVHEVRPNGSKYVIHTGVLKTDMIFIESQPRFNIFSDLVAAAGTQVVTKFVFNRDDTFEISDVELELTTTNHVGYGFIGVDHAIELTKMIFAENGYTLGERVNIGNRYDLVAAMLENIYNN